MQPGTVIAGKYRLTRHIGDGAMGSVWAALNEFTHREFALKLIRASEVGSDELRRRLLREASATGRLRQRNVVEVFDVGQTEEGEPFLVLELLHGRSLQSLLEESGRFSTEALAIIGTDIARALEAAHAAGIVHRDLKPANVFLHEDPERGKLVKVLDFGVSKVMTDSSSTATGSALGSPAYMSPEQARGLRTLDHRTDLWSLGVLLFELATARRPFEAETPFAVVAEILRGPIPRLAAVLPGCDPRLDTLIARCLVREVDRRIGSASEVISALAPMVPAGVRPVQPSSAGGDPRASAQPEAVPPPPSFVLAPAAVLRSASPPSEIDSARIVVGTDPASSGDATLHAPSSTGSGGVVVAAVTEPASVASSTAPHVSTVPGQSVTQGAEASAQVAASAGDGAGGFYTALVQGAEGALSVIGLRVRGLGALVLVGGAPVFALAVLGVALGVAALVPGAPASSASPVVAAASPASGSDAVPAVSAQPQAAPAASVEPVATPSTSAAPIVAAMASARPKSSYHPVSGRTTVRGGACPPDKVIIDAAGKKRCIR